MPCDNSWARMLHHRHESASTSTRTRANSRDFVARSLRSSASPRQFFDSSRQTTWKGFQWESEAPAELGVGSAGASPSRYSHCCGSPCCESRSLVLRIVRLVATHRTHPTLSLGRRIDSSEKPKLPQGKPAGFMCDVKRRNYVKKAEVIGLRLSDSRYSRPLDRRV